MANPDGDVRLAISVSDAQFAKKANYFVALQLLKSRSQRRRTEVCEAAERPQFAKATFEFSLGAGPVENVLSASTEETVQVGAFVVLGPTPQGEDANGGQASSDAVRLTPPRDCNGARLRGALLQHARYERLALRRTSSPTPSPKGRPKLLGSATLPLSRIATRLRRGERLVEEMELIRKPVPTKEVLVGRLSLHVVIAGERTVLTSIQDSPAEALSSACVFVRQATAMPEIEDGDEHNSTCVARFVKHVCRSAA